MVDHTLPEYLQRTARAREFNLALVQRRQLDRETYRGLRNYVRCPRNLDEAARNARWRSLHTLLTSKVADAISRDHFLGYIRQLRDPATVRALVASRCIL